MSSFKDKKRPVLSAKGMRFGIALSRYNSPVTTRLLSGAQKVLSKFGAKGVDLLIVPGAFEIPYTLKKLAFRKKYDALIALGCVIRGETPHFDFLCEGVTSGTMKVMLDEKIPIAFGLLTTNNLKQALARTGGKAGHKGEEAALVAIEMAQLK
ncbi:MAG: 6,7-dimethyl-8-ribityllumazine synthase [Deltaproteobacteria bacterium]|nr:6,7-dimethyl-8-ribityllumazine synthase [Deltaproteobacteria bacterium]MBI4374509.1 6,7-dimethyl-8-ribityllumazine synthase [Deltaproteobacteria bacterium]